MKSTTTNQPPPHPFTKQLPHGYRLCGDGLFRKEVRFDVPNRPEIVNVIVMVRSRDGELMRTEKGQWKTKTPVDI
jgi:hypothetical protein